MIMGGRCVILGEVRKRREEGRWNAAAVEERGAKECRGCVKCSCVHHTLKGTPHCECNAAMGRAEEHVAVHAGAAAARSRRAAGNESLLV
jgi:hypothetical protein